MTVLQALEILDPKNIVFSTDSDEYLNIVSKFDILLHKRESYLATSKSGKIDTLKKLTELYSADFYIDLDPTSPIRTKKDIQNFLQSLKRNKHALLSVCEMNSINPYFNMIEKKNDRYITTSGSGTFKRSQDVPKVYFILGMIGWAKIFLTLIKHFMNAKI